MSFQPWMMRLPPVSMDVDVFNGHPQLRRPHMQELTADPNQPGMDRIIADFGPVDSYHERDSYPERKNRTNDERANHTAPQYAWDLLREADPTGQRTIVPPCPGHFLHPDRRCEEAHLWNLILNPDVNEGISLHLPHFDLPGAALCSISHIPNT